MRLANDRFLIVVAPGTCYSCAADNHFIQLILPPGSRLVDGEDDHPFEENDGAEFIKLSWIESISSSALVRVNEVAPLWKVGESKTLQESVFMNHCVGCGTHQGDFYLTKPDMPFWPMTEEDARAIRVLHIDCQIEVETMSMSSGLLFAIGNDGVCSLPGIPEKSARKRRGRRAKI